MARPEPREGATLATRLEGAAGSLLAAGLLLVLVEACLIARRTDLSLRGWVAQASLGVVVVFWLSLLAAALAGSLALLGSSVLARAGLSRRVSDALAASATGLAVGLVATVVMRPWNLRTDPLHFAFSVPAACMLIWPLGARLVRARPRLCAGLAVLVAAILCELNARYYRGLYVSLHHGLLWLVWAALAGVVALRPRAGRFARAAPWLLALAAHAGLFEAASAREVAVLHGELTPTLLGALQRLTDRDLDGYSALLGGGDCDDASADVHPGSCEVAGNGVDDNCNGAVDRAALPVTVPARANAAPTLRSPMPDVYFVIVDTLRGDYGAGSAGVTRPRALGAFAAQALDFSRAYAAYPATFKSLSAMLQSRSPRRYRAGSPDLGTLLARAGFEGQLWIADQTLSVSDTPGADWPLTSQNHPFHADVRDGWATWSERIVERAIAELDTASATPRFRWLHFLDLHGPWAHAPAGGDLRRRYTAELKHVERLLERLLTALTSHPRTRHAVIVVMGDHGEQLGEHGGTTWHDAYVWEESIRTPLFMRLPGVQPRRISAPASLLDVAPTLCSYLGLPAPSTFEGHDWLHVAPRARAVVSEVGGTDHGGGVGNPARSAVVGQRYKLVHDVSANVVSLYDLELDPFELYPLHRDHIPESDALFAELVRFQDEPGCTLP